MATAYWEHPPDCDLGGCKDCLCCLRPVWRFCYPQRDDLRGVNALYTNPTLWRSPLPALSAILYMLSGIYLLDIGYVIYINPGLYATITPGELAPPLVRSALLLQLS